MIERILTKGMWIGASGNVPQAHSATIFIGQNYIQQPYVTAKIEISRFEGNGFAKAYIFSGEYKAGIFSTEVLTQPVEPPMNSDDPLRLVNGHSQYHFKNAVSVTFGLYVMNMFAYANCSVFVHKSRNVADVLLSPINYLGDALVGTGSLQDTKSTTNLVYDKKSGEIVHRHTSVVLQNNNFPNEKDLKASALNSALAMTKYQDSRQFDVLTVLDDLVPNKDYKVNVKSGQLVAKNVKRKKTYR